MFIYFFSFFYLDSVQRKITRLHFIYLFFFHFVQNASTKDVSQSSSVSPSSNNYHDPRRSLSIHVCFPLSRSLTLHVPRSERATPFWKNDFPRFTLAEPVPSLGPFSRVFFCRGYLSSATRRSVDARLSREVAREKVTATC